MGVVLRRAVVLVAGVAGAVVSGGFLVREAALALDDGLKWDLPEWCSWLTEQPGAVRVIVAAVLAGLAALLCFVGAVRTLRRPAAPVRRLDLGNDGAGVVVDGSALDKLLAKTLRRGVPALEGAKVWLYREEDTYALRVAGHLSACVDLPRLHEQAASMLKEELRRSTGLQVARVDLEIEKLEMRTKGVS